MARGVVERDDKGVCRHAEHLALVVRLKHREVSWKHHDFAICVTHLSCLFSELHDEF